jgi:hypothetical protein
MHEQGWRKPVRVALEVVAACLVLAGLLWVGVLLVRELSPLAGQPPAASQAENPR